jgi:hypothetical protein
MRDMIRHLARVAMAIGFLLSARGVAEACTCSGFASCGDLTQADAVIEATIESIALAPPPKMPPGSDDVYTELRERVNVARLKDVKAWRGEAPVSLIAGFGSCAVTFHAGKRYLIAASRVPNGDYDVTACSFIREINEDTQPVLDYLRDLTGGATDARAIGRVSRVTGWYGQPGLTPISGAEVTISGKGTFTRISDDAGRFEVRGMPPGEYSIRARADGVPVPIDRLESTFWVGDGPSCAELHVTVPATGRLHGVVLEEDGSPLRDAFIELLSAEELDGGRRPGIGLTLPRGRYQLDDIPPGRYTISINRKVGPSRKAPFLEAETAVFAVEEGRTVTAPPLRVTRLTPVKTTVTITSADGAPMVGIQAQHFMLFRDGNRERLWPPKTDEQGRYEVELWKGLRSVVVVGPEHDPSAWVEFVADDSSITVTFRPR